VIAVQSLSKRYGSTVAVDGLSFTVRPGSILGFLGPNGAGKTTTLRVLLGLAEQGIRWLRDFLRSMAAVGRTILVSSHVLAEVSQTVDEVVVIHRGRLRAHSTLAELTRRREGASVRVRSPEAGRLAELLRSTGALVDARGPGRLVVREISPERVGDLAAEHRIPLHELVAETTDASLEEAFLELTSDGDAGPE
jgi:ABC-2 type transport system ATP-binding protein